MNEEVQPPMRRIVNSNIGVTNIFEEKDVKTTMMKTFDELVLQLRKIETHFDERDCSEIVMQTKQKYNEVMEKTSQLRDTLCDFDSKLLDLQQLIYAFIAEPIGL